MSQPVVVQGTAVHDPYASTEEPSYQVSAPSSIVKGEKQESRCRDPMFAILFYINIGAILGVAMTYGVPAFEDTENLNFYTGYVYAAAVTGVFALIVSGLSLGVMMAIPGPLIKVSLIVVVVMTGIWAVFAIMAGQLFAGILGLVFFALSLCYARAVWPRVPFATANLLTATTAVRNNLGVAFFAYIFTAVAVAWSCVWTLALIGLWDKTYTCTDNSAGGQVCTDPNYGLLFLLFLSFFFAHQVFQNTIHVICAGAVGTWWFSPEDSGCCASSVRGSFVRAITTSFGSICFGSLIVAIIQALKQLAQEARSNGDGNALACVAQCILGCLESIVEYFNKWAFVYVGLYGYGYMEAGKNVITLFKNRGWDSIIADDLVGNVLFLISLVVAGISGVVGIIVERSTDFFEAADGNVATNTASFAFLLAFIVGLVICSILMSTIGSAVNTVIVLFAEAPAEFDQHYPDLSHQMRDAWSGVYPNEFH